MKRAVYAVGTLGTISVLLGLIVLAILRDPARSEVSVSPTPSFMPVEVGDVVVIPHRNQQSGVVTSADIVAQIRNPNLRAGVSQYVLTFTVYDTAGEVIETSRDETYLMPGATQYAMVLGINVPSNRRIGRVEVVKPQDISFIRLPDEVSVPRFSVFLRDRMDRMIGNRSLQTQTGVVTNTSTFDWQRVEVRAVAMDSSRNIIAVGKTFVGRLLVGEQREFSVEWPTPEGTVTQVVVIPGTNMFEEENVVDVIGDPGTLR